MALFKRAQVSVLLDEPDRSQRIRLAYQQAPSDLRRMIQNESLFREIGVAVRPASRSAPSTKDWRTQQETSATHVKKRLVGRIDTEMTARRLGKRRHFCIVQTEAPDDLIS